MKKYKNIETVSMPYSNKVAHYMILLKQSSSKLLSDIIERITLQVHFHVWYITTINTQAQVVVGPLSILFVSSWQGM